MIDGRRAITTKDVEYFRYRTYIGCRMRCMVLAGELDNKTLREEPAECIIYHKGKHVAVTSQGTMQWTLLTIWNLGLLKQWEDRERQRQEWQREKQERRRHEDGLYFIPV